MDFDHFCNFKLEKLEKSGLLRSLRKSQGIDFCSNDYLNLSENQELKVNIVDSIGNFPLGSTGSRLLRGHSKISEALETKLATFCQSEEALFFSTGYQANIGFLSAILKERARVFSDERVHASIIDGIRLSSCEKHIWKHNSLTELELLLKKYASKDKMNFIIVESIYSMTGSLAPLLEIVFLCRLYSVHLIVDEAHATGLYGARGSGKVEELGLKESVFASVHTAGKALGVSGAWISCSKKLKDFLVNAARPFIFSTAPSFYQQLAVIEAIDFFDTNKDKLVTNFVAANQYFEKALQPLVEKFNLKILGKNSPVHAVVVGNNSHAISLMKSLNSFGLDIRAIRAPSVPFDESLLRITIPRLRTKDDIDKLIAALLHALKEPL